MTCILYSFTVPMGGRPQVSGERRRGVEEEGSGGAGWEALEPILEHSLGVLHGLLDGAFCSGGGWG